MAFYFDSSRHIDANQQILDIYLNEKEQVILNLDTELEEGDYEYLTLDFAECINLRNKLNEIIEHFISLTKE
jgi:hypothetical protein